MNASELMIGDWVLLTNNPARVISIARDEIYFEDRFGKGACSFDKIRPIHLTAEILEKNRFKKDTGGEECWANSKGWFTPHEYGKRDTIKSWEVEICGKINSFDGIIKYIHELQHALCLCGIEKEIVL